MELAVGNIPVAEKCGFRCGLLCRFGRVGMIRHHPTTAQMIVFNRHLQFLRSSRAAFVLDAVPSVVLSNLIGFFAQIWQFSNKLHWNHSLRSSQLSAKHHFGRTKTIFKRGIAIR